MVGSTSTGTPSLTVNGSFTTGDTVSITNNGTISGKGGAGGGTHSNGAAAGDGISLAFATTIDNQGDLAGGGGGGGGGQRRKGAVTSGKDCGETKTGKGGTGGGGAGDDVGTGGGSPTLTVGGTGNNGSKGGGCAPKGGTGGGGGGRGRAGSSGSTGSYGSCTCNRSSNGAGSGGAAGDYITGNSYATWDNTRQRIWRSNINMKLKVHDYSRKDGSLIVSVGTDGLTDEDLDELPKLAISADFTRGNTD